MVKLILPAIIALVLLISAPRAVWQLFHTTAIVAVEVTYTALEIGSELNKTRSEIRESLCQSAHESMDPAIEVARIAAAETESTTDDAAHDLLELAVDLVFPCEPEPQTP